MDWKEAMGFAMDLLKKQMPPIEPLTYIIRSWEDDLTYVVDEIDYEMFFFEHDKFLQKYKWKWFNPLIWQNETSCKKTVRVKEVN